MDQRDPLGSRRVLLDRLRWYHPYARLKQFWERFLRADLLLRPIALSGLTSGFLQLDLCRAHLASSV
jgi:hypothetical protein